MSEKEKNAFEVLECFEPDDLIECAIYRNALKKVKEQLNNSIPVKKIEEKIEKLKKELEINKDNVMYQKLIYTSKEVIKEEIYDLQQLIK